MPARVCYNEQSCPNAKRRAPDGRLKDIPPKPVKPRAPKVKPHKYAAHTNEAKWPNASDDFWAIKSRPILDIIHRIQPATADDVKAEALDKLGYREILTIQCLAWLSIAHLAGYDLQTALWTASGGFDDEKAKGIPSGT